MSIAPLVACLALVSQDAGSRPSDGRAVVRLEGKLYARELVRILDDAELFDALGTEARRKYGVGLTADVFRSGGAWLFELKPRAS